MYYHTDMRYVALSLLIVLACSASQPLAGREPPQTPRFRLTGSVERDWGLAPLADWRRLREFDGIGWKLGTVARGDGSVMHSAYTVVHPAKGEPFVLQHCYVLAAFDLLPGGILLVAVRDPEYYRKGYDYEQGVVDPVEAVWYSDDWQEEAVLELPFAPEDEPDGFILGPDQRSLLAIRHPVDADGEPAPSGHSLAQVSLEQGWLRTRYLPEYSADGTPPLGWQPLRMEWDGGALLVQAGPELRRYRLEWE
jgi:hypothetical protein